MRKTIIWLIVIAALTCYSLAVYSWWVEGNLNAKIQEVNSENSFSRY